MIVAASLVLIGTTTEAQSLMVVNSPRPFSVVAPATWVQQPTTTGNSRVKFSSPSGTPRAECAVIVIDSPALRGFSQEYFNAIALDLPAASDLAYQLTSRYNNVGVWGVGFATISGFPAQSYNVRYSVGSPIGEIWGTSRHVTAMTAPGFAWVVSCGGLGKTPQEADIAFSHWQIEILRFSTNVRIL